jgi:hypothetical protein
MTNHITIDQFIYTTVWRKRKPRSGYMYIPTGQLWTAAGVDARVERVRDNGRLIKASVWLKTEAMLKEVRQ